MRHVVRDYASKLLADDVAVRVIDETGFLKQGLLRMFVLSANEKGCPTGGRLGAASPGRLWAMAVIHHELTQRRSPPTSKQTDPGASLRGCALMDWIGAWTMSACACAS
jgi:hypothetical protein